VPAVDVVECEKAYEIKAEMPGMDEKKIEVKEAGRKREVKEAGRKRGDEGAIICKSANLARSNEASVFLMA